MTTEDGQANIPEAESDYARELRKLLEEYQPEQQVKEITDNVPDIPAILYDRQGIRFEKYPQVILRLEEHPDGTKDSDPDTHHLILDRQTQEGENMPGGSFFMMVTQDAVTLGQASTPDWFEISRRYDATGEKRIAPEDILLQGVVSPNGQTPRGETKWKFTPEIRYRSGRRDSYDEESFTMKNAKGYFTDPTQPSFLYTVLFHGRLIVPRI